MRRLRRATRILAFGAVAVLIAHGARADRTEVFGSPYDIEPLQPGARVPTVAVETVHEELVDVAGLVRETGALLVFYRGGW